MTTYPFVPSYWDQYGTRDATLGLMLHMAEGTGTVGYLDKVGRIPPRGVSVHFVCETTGRMVQMLRLDQASGSLNPADRSTDKAYYGHSHLVAVLGAWWPNPNEAVISIEIEGFAATGPNGRQQTALVEWAADMVRQYPTIRGALGHADQTNTKGCPGTTAAMKAVFASIGGHGLWTLPDTTEDPMVDFAWDGAKARLGNLVVNGPGHSYMVLKDGTLHPAPPPFPKRAFGPIVVATGTILGDTLDRRTGWLIPAAAAFLLATDTTFTPDASDTKRTVALTVEGVQQFTMEV